MNKLTGGKKKQISCAEKFQIIYVDTLMEHIAPLLKCGLHINIFLKGTVKKGEKKHKFTVEKSDKHLRMVNINR